MFILLHITAICYRSVRTAFHLASVNKAYFKVCFEVCKIWLPFSYQFKVVS